MKRKKRIKQDVKGAKRSTSPARLVLANVVLKPASGKSVIRAGPAIRPSNVKEFLPRRETLEEAGRVLTELGFQIDLFAETHISIRGPRALYEQVFQVRLAEKADRDSGTFQGRRKSLQRYFVSKTAPRLPRQLAELVETLEFPGPIVYHVPSPTPPPLSYDHMEVPEDVARVMDALKAHARGITGAGIRLAMVDSGFTTPFHPYYVGKGYNIQPVVADPTDPTPNDDSYGHGTAMAACALAVAPGVTFTMYKNDQFNLALAFSRAVMDSPHIITCSWGSLVLDTALRLAINNAVAAGIVVLFACGNKVPVSWPGSEPAVISVGGVFVGSDDSVRAADHASSGTNVLNPGRQCPDVCGICGLKPKGILIALPTQAGSDGDVKLAGPGYPNFDETTSGDAWLVTSGTSAAAPMVAGVAALLMQNDPTMVGDPAKVRTALTTSCLDVTAGSSASGEAAGPGPDLATGAGLVQAYRAIRTTDVWIRDNPDSDIGWVPTHNRRPAWPPYAHWRSPDIKVFAAPLANPGADFDPSPAENPVFGQDNHVYVRIRNRGTQATPIVNVRLYYADPATSLIFPMDWQDGQSGVPAQGSLQVGGVGTNLQTFPSVAAGSHNVLPIPFVWRPPDPTTATQTQTLPDGRTLGHFCLLVRLECADDPIILAGGGQGSVIYDNNIGMANQDVYSAPPGYWFYFTFFVRGGTKREGITTNDLLFDLSRLPRASRATVETGRPLSGDTRLVNAERAKGKLQLRVGRKPAGIRDLTLTPETRTLVKVAVEVPPGARPGDYPIAVLQRSGGQALGGMTLIARVSQ